MESQTNMNMAQIFVLDFNLLYYFKYAFDPVRLDAWNDPWTLGMGCLEMVPCQHFKKNVALFLKRFDA